MTAVLYYTSLAMLKTRSIYGDLPQNGGEYTFPAVHNVQERQNLEGDYLNMMAVACVLSSVTFKNVYV